MKEVRLNFQEGNILIPNLNKISSVPILQQDYLIYDSRTKSYRCYAYHYKNLIFALRGNVDYQDSVKDYQELQLELKLPFQPYDYQKEAVYSWSKQKSGIIVLPTGAGKSVVAAMIIAKIQRSSIILVPTIELLIQWHKNLENFFNCKIGILGGGDKEILPITVSTYESARIYQNKLGNQFCLMIFDECHHLGSETSCQMAKSFIAPYRLGLTATPEEDFFRTELVKEVLGEIVYEKMIRELSGEYLANYRVQTIFVRLTAKEQEKYDYHRNIYLNYKNSLGYITSWQEFIFGASKSAQGRKAMQSFYLQKQISYYTENKLLKLIELLFLHKKDKILIFTNDNKTTYQLSNKLLLPAITHEIKSFERKKILEKFHSNQWNVLISTRVLNEGVDLPAANVAIIISGNSTVKEQVQRLGRVLRKKKQNKAYLYELVTEGTSELFTSKKRKKHLALQINNIS